MPSERLCLKRTRQHLIQSLDVTTILPRLCAGNYFSADEERTILADPRRRDRVAVFLDMVAAKGTEAFKAFSNALADESPHLFLVMSEWDKEDSFASSGHAGSSTSLECSLANIDGRAIGCIYV